MLNGNKPWQKIVFENFLMILSLMAILLTRIAGKIMSQNFGIYNLLTLVLAIIGFVFLVYSKREQLKKKEFMNFGVGSQDPKDLTCYRLGYFFLISGLILTFII